MSFCQKFSSYAAIIPRDFPKLFRIDVQHTHIGTAGEKGTELGLILYQELAERNGGKSWVESEVGKGTTFRFTLPRKESEEQIKKDAINQGLLRSRR